MIRTTTWLFAAALASLDPSFAQTGQIEDLGSLPGRWASANSISREGRVIAGTLERSASPARTDAFRWTAEDGLAILGTINSADAAATMVSADGSYVVGGVSGSRAVRWGLDGIPLDLGTIPGGGFATFPRSTSSDGETIVGQASLQQANIDHAFVWTEVSGMLDIHPPVGALSSSALHVSSDASTVVIEVGSVPASATRLFLWSQTGGHTEIPLPGINRLLRVVASEDASVIAAAALLVGGGGQALRWTSATGWVGVGPYQAMLESTVALSPDGGVVFGREPTGPYRWTEAGGYQVIVPDPEFRFTSGSTDGSVLYGYREVIPFQRYSAFRWTAATGFQDLPTLGGLLNSLDARFFPRRSPYVSADGSVATAVSRTPSDLARAVRWDSSGGIGSKYCGPAAPNSVSAAGASIELSGSNAVVLGSLELQASDLPRFTFGYFITSPTRAFTPFPGGSEGNLCVGGAIGRFNGSGQVLPTGSDGRIQLVIDPALMPSPTGTVTPAFGET